MNHYLFCVSLYHSPLYFRMALAWVTRVCAGNQSSAAVQMWFSKCAKQRIRALAARFSYTCGEPCIDAPAAAMHVGALSTELARQLACLHASSGACLHDNLVCLCIPTKYVRSELC